MTKQLARPVKIFIWMNLMRRILSLIFLLPLGVLTVFCFIGYANVVDTMSMKMGSFFMYQVFFWIACGGMASLFICQGLRLFAARWILIVSLLICAGFTVFSIAAYPGNHDDPHVPRALSHSLRELHILLIATTLLLTFAVFEPRVRRLVTKIVR
ncbi:hypothetical protein RY831_13555 [Noviherbaspirillum sp. CPCC 100848]|uniref:DUF4149 domain-containing protein n=1 Tax=Noviherbaspirillum album TaxID=3080276 RepID=A0ABU6J9S9_9BURK|nr:hypothetical protein [Noviherbaspirillum sp. CPCC 100848]MEC4720183.1 hypothetical protein [Noviherbaspirillum sp. CPCC 100848]